MIHKRWGFERKNTLAFMHRREKKVKSEQKRVKRRKIRSKSQNDFTICVKKRHFSLFCTITVHGFQKIQVAIFLEKQYNESANVRR